ncbi:hypothetical protein COOONC_14708 [Cooperia oncophora]
MPVQDLTSAPAEIVFSNPHEVDTPPTCGCCASNCNHINRIVVGPLYRQRSNETHENSREDHQEKDTSVEEPLLEDHDPFVASLQLLERIGSGHFADVFRASSNLGDVAVKVYHADQATFDNEFDNLTLLQSLKHPNTVQLVSTDKMKHSLLSAFY